MIEYTYHCSKCENNFTKFWLMAEYDKKNKNVKCPNCKTKKVYRDYATDQITSNVVPMLSECNSLQRYAEKQSKQYGKEKCEKMAEGFTAYKKNKKGGMEKLPSGMRRYDGAETMPAELTKPAAKKKRRASNKRKKK